ncbi:hypothetical protein MMC19_002271 [Ptychographa xylographoides]|nr:hypothetical protein [Ptychographa xylographoides]
MTSTTRPSNTNTNGPPVEKSYFEKQREALVSEITITLEHVLQNINKLNRSLEGVIAVGNEFGSVEALWSQFEGVMARSPDGEGGGTNEGIAEEDYAGDDEDGDRKGEEEQKEDQTTRTGEGRQ